ncbi:MAG: TonB-dependent receptor, partial [Flavobacteriales bacterium]|nr:TonB-dependent receptor [Flavobacteriales bacterium]
QFSMNFDSTNIKNFNLTTGIVNTWSQSTSQLFAGGIDSSEAFASSTAQNNAAYLQLDKKFWDRLTVSGGARLERFKINEEEETQPVFRSGASWKIGGDSSIFRETYLRASYGQGFRFPTIAEKFIRTEVGVVRIFPNPDLKSEKSQNIEFGLKQGFKIGQFLGYLDIAAYQQNVKDAVEFNFGNWSDQIDLSGFSTFGFKSINVAESRIRGIDVSLSGKGNIGDVEIIVLGGYTYLDPVNLNPDEIIDTVALALRGAAPLDLADMTYRNTSSDTSGILKYRFRHMVKADIQFNYGNWGLGGSYRYLSHMDNIDVAFLVLDDFGDAGLPTGLRKYREERDGQGMPIVDARLQYKVSETMRVGLIVNNLMNNEIMIRPLDVERPRTFNLQFSWTL